MSALAKQQEDIGQYQSETKLIIDAFKDGSMHKNDREKYFRTAGHICAHFEKAVSNIDAELNAMLTSCFVADAVDNETLDDANEYFESFEDFATYICSDFKSFTKTVYKVVAKPDLPQKLRIRINLLENRIEFLHKKVEQCGNDVMSILYGLAPKELLKQRAM